MTAPWDASPRFGLAHEITQGYEGGVSRDPNDRAVRDVAPGQVHTYRGVRQATWDAWCKFKGWAPSSVATATVTQVRELYWSWYWLQGGCQRWPAPLDLVAFDCAVNHGTGRAVQWIQAMVGVATDGKPGPITQGAVEDRDPDHAAEHLLWIRARLFLTLARDPVQERNLRGWIGLRCLDLRQRWVWRDRALPSARPHREEWTCWIELRELHAQAADPQLRPRLLAGLPGIIERRYAGWAGRMDPVRWGVHGILEPESQPVKLPPRALRPFRVGRIISRVAPASPSIA